ncbi:hypothetical protein BE04_00430 [Sorangium cellulosum]|nr:hypothetical protein BE04_00430 [Sorangium cellulosum]
MMLAGKSNAVYRISSTPGLRIWLPTASYANTSAPAVFTACGWSGSYVYSPTSGFSRMFPFGAYVVSNRQNRSCRAAHVRRSSLS